MGRIIRGIDRGARVVADVADRATDLVRDDVARSFEVRRVDTGEDLTTECFDQPPTDEQIARRLDQTTGQWTCPDRVDGAANPARRSP
ncbi:MAG: hypothetical protein ACRDSK_32490 [Actinophytocola sp.]|uniref:hypothetical protein n=1 Tax=Actinophytocola sp. TaxID=1872138 RepID=UPI003D6B88F5